MSKKVVEISEARKRKAEAEEKAKLKKQEQWPPPGESQFGPLYVE